MWMLCCGGGATQTWGDSDVGRLRRGATQTWMLVQVETQPPAPVSGPRLALRLPAALTRDRPVRWRLAWEGQGRSRGVWRLKF